MLLVFSEQPKKAAGYVITADVSRRRWQKAGTNSGQQKASAATPSPPEPENPSVCLPNRISVVVNTTSSTDWWVAGPTLAAVILSLIFGVYNLYTTNESLRIANKQFIQATHAELIEDRPWVKTLRAGVSLDNALGLPGFFVTVKNVGKLPATNIRFTIIGGKEGMTRDISIRREDVGRMPNETILSPGDEEHRFFTPTVIVLPGNKIEPNSLAYTRGYAKGSFRLDGGITYTDLNATKGYTRFCYMLIDGESKFNCPVDNEMQ